MSLRRLLPLSCLGLLAGLSLACIVADIFPEPCESGANNVLNDAGECECLPDFTWCDPDDPEELSCCEIGTEETGETGSDG